jgi:sorting nexin-25
MDRRNRSRLVQFWLTVEGFKDPLEAADQDFLSSIPDLDDKASNTSSHQTIGEDVTFLHEAYFAGGSDTLEIPARHVSVIREAAHRNAEGSIPRSEVRRIKQAMFGAQKSVYEQMEEEDWRVFRKSGLYLKALADLSRSAVPARADLGHQRVLVPPPQVKRNVTAPVALFRRLTEGPTTPQRVLNSLIGVNQLSSNSSTAATSPASSRTERPTVETRHTTRDLYRIIENPVSTRASIPLAPSTPPHLPRRSSQLDFLISGAGTPESGRDRANIFGDEGEDLEEEDDEDYEQIQRMEAIQAALTSIIASDDLLLPDVPPEPSPDISVPSSPSASLMLPRTATNDHPKRSSVSRSLEDLRPAPIKAKSAPQTRVSSQTVSTGLMSSVSPPDSVLSPTLGKMDKLFFDGDNDDELSEEQFAIEDEAHDVVQLAAPGNLQLSVEIARLQDRIQELVKQDYLLNALIRQAELTGNVSELRLLVRSQSSIRRQERTAIFQKAQFEQQEEENRLMPGRTRVGIPSTMVTEEEGGRQVVRYTVEVKQLADDGSVALSWVVARRYNEFWEMDRAVRDWAGDSRLAMEDLKSKVVDLPGKRLGTNLSASSIDARRLGLERYLQVSRECVAYPGPSRCHLLTYPVPRLVELHMRQSCSEGFPFPLASPARRPSHDFPYGLAAKFGTAQHCQVNLQDYGQLAGRCFAGPEHVGSHVADA